MNWKTPGPVIWAVFFAGIASVWIVIALRVFYGLILGGLDVAINMAIFITVMGWWTERMQNL